MNDKPQVIRVDPKNLDDEVQGPVLRGLIERGWTVGTSVILEDPNKPDYDRIRLGLVMLPPHPDRGARDADPDEAARRAYDARLRLATAVSCCVAAVAAVVCAVVLAAG